MDVCHFISHSILWLLLPASTKSTLRHPREHHHQRSFIPKERIKSPKTTTNDLGKLCRQHKLNLVNRSSYSLTDIHPDVMFRHCSISLNIMSTPFFLASHTSMWAQPNDFVGPKLSPENTIIAVSIPSIHHATDGITSFKKYIYNL